MSPARRCTMPISFNTLLTGCAGERTGSARPALLGACMRCRTRRQRLPVAARRPEHRPCARAGRRRRGRSRPVVLHRHTDAPLHKRFMLAYLALM